MRFDRLGLFCIFFNSLSTKYNIILLAMLLPFIAQADKQVNSLNKKESLNTLDMISKNSKIGAIYNQTFTDKLKDEDEKNKLQKEIQNADIILNGIEDICILFKNNSFSEKEILIILDNITELGNKVISPQKIGSGNVILNHVITSLKVCLIYNLLHNNDKSVEEIMKINPFGKNIYDNLDKFTDLFETEYGYKYSHKLGSTFELFMDALKRNPAFINMMTKFPGSTDAQYVSKALMHMPLKLKTFSEQMKTDDNTGWILESLCNATRFICIVALTDRQSGMNTDISDGVIEKYITDYDRHLLDIYLGKDDVDMQICSARRYTINLSNKSAIKNDMIEGILSGLTGKKSENKKEDIEPKK